MPSDQVSQSPTPTQASGLHPEALEFLYHEYDTLKDVYAQSLDRLQNRFNFYLVSLSAVVGASTLVVQNAAANPLWPFVLIGLALFLSIIGLIFESSIVMLYADVHRYALAMDEVREYIVGHLPEAAPPLYSHLVIHPLRADSPQQLQASGLARWGKRLLSWLSPEGMFQASIAFINSICFALIIPIFVFGACVPSRTPPLSSIVLASVVTFWLTLIVQNVYARLRKRQTLLRRLKRLDTPQTSEDGVNS
jgi:hypothetical protein